MVSVRASVTSPVQLHRLNATTALHRLTAPTALHSLTAHYIALPPLPHYNVSARPLQKFICQNIDISNAKFRRARTFCRINYSRKHLTHSKFSKHGHFTCIPTIVLRINNNPNRIIRNNCIQKFREGAQIVFPRLFFEYIIIRIML